MSVSAPHRGHGGPPSLIVIALLGLRARRRGFLMGPGEFGARAASTEITLPVEGSMRRTSDAAPWLPVSNRDVLLPPFCAAGRRTHSGARAAARSLALRLGFWFIWFFFFFLVSFLVMSHDEGSRFLKSPPPPHRNFTG